MSTPEQPHHLTILFARGILARLALWPALRLAVHASWGGPASAEKQRWLAGVLVDQFEPFIVSVALPLPVSATATVSAPTPSSSVSSTLAPNATPTSTAPDEDDVAELLLQIMADEFEVVLEDDSAPAVARDVIKLFMAVCAGDGSFVGELEVQAERVKGKVPQHEIGVGSESNDSGSDWEDETEDEDGMEVEDDPVPQLLSHSKEESQVDEDGFTLVKKKGRR